MKSEINLNSINLFNNIKIGSLIFVLFYCIMKRRDNGSVYSFRYILVLGKNFNLVSVNILFIKMYMFLK